ncbi:MAG TPA: hypothetical protein VGY52_09375 [Roseiarcus sp.]|jgi:hypothetical protein|nr:hypothetical protein [Roseiarcus sp.]
MNDQRRPKGVSGAPKSCPLVMRLAVRLAEARRFTADLPTTGGSPLPNRTNCHMSLWASASGATGAVDVG